MPWSRSALRCSPGSRSRCPHESSCRAVALGARRRAGPRLVPLLPVPGGISTAEPCETAFAVRTVWDTVNDLTMWRINDYAFY